MSREERGKTKRNRKEEKREKERHEEKKEEKRRRKIKKGSNRRQHNTITQELMNREGKIEWRRRNGKGKGVEVVIAR